jgi:hypothetical protein
VGEIEGTDHGFAAWGSFKIRENDQPRRYRLKRKRLPRVRSLGDDIAVARARVARAFDLMRRAAEAQLVQEYAAKLAGLSLCLRPGEVAAAAQRLRAERDAAVSAMRVLWRARERDHITRSVGILVAARRAASMLRRAKRRRRMVPDVHLLEPARQVVTRSRREPYRNARASRHTKRPYPILDPS